MDLSRSRSIARPAVLAFLLTAACGKGATTAARATVDGEVADSTSGAIVMVTSDGGNTAVTSEWTLDSTGAAVTFVSRQKGAAAGTPPTAQSATIINGNVVKQLFAATQTAEFRALKAHYPRVAPIPDMATTTITIVANGRRRVIDGDYPDPAVTVVQQLMGLVPPARP
jgi:hypothetical protein